jgi:hypothetical protein
LEVSAFHQLSLAQHFIYFASARGNLVLGDNAKSIVKRVQHTQLRLLTLRNTRPACKNKQAELLAQWNARDPIREAERTAAKLQKVGMSQCLFEFHLGGD